MKKTAIIMASILLLGCQLKNSQKNIQTEISFTDVPFIADGIPVSNKSFRESKPPLDSQETSPRIRDLDWYIGSWQGDSIMTSDENWNPKNYYAPVEIEIKRADGKYYISLNENGRITEGKIYIDKYFLPKNIPEDEKVNYDSSDYVVADFETLRYCIGIVYDGDYEHDTISLSLDDIDFCECKREKKL